MGPRRSRSSASFASSGRLDRRDRSAVRAWLVEAGTRTFVAKVGPGARGRGRRAEAGARGAGGAAGPRGRHGGVRPPRDRSGCTGDTQPRTRRSARPGTGDLAPSSLRSTGAAAPRGSGIAVLILHAGPTAPLSTAPDSASWPLTAISTTSWTEWPTGSRTCCHRVARHWCTATCGGAMCCSAPTAGRG